MNQRIADSLVELPQQLPAKILVEIIDLTSACTLLCRDGAFCNLLWYPLFCEAINSALVCGCQKEAVGRDNTMDNAIYAHIPVNAPCAGVNG